MSSADKKRGFSVVEVLIVAVIMAFLTVVITVMVPKSERTLSSLPPTPSGEATNLQDRWLLEHPNGALSLVIFRRENGKCLIIDSPDSIANEISVDDLVKWNGGVFRILKPDDPDYAVAAKKFLLQRATMAT